MGRLPSEEDMIIPLLAARYKTSESVGGRGGQEAVTLPDGRIRERRPRAVYDGASLRLSA